MSQLLRTLRNTLVRVNKLRMFEPEDEMMAEIERTLRNKIAQLEKSERSSMAAD